MSLWLKRKGRWLRAHALPPYLPPRYLGLAPGSPPGPAWRLSGPLGPYGADSLAELLQGLLVACRRPPGGAPPGLWRITGSGELAPVDGITPFDPETVPPTLELVRLRQPRDKWLISLQVARPSRSLLAVQHERYLASWRTALERLLAACKR